METFPQYTGLPTAKTKEIPRVIVTCRGCRTWASPSPVTVPQTSATPAFNEEGETDLVFYNSCIAQHFMRRCIW